MADHKQISKTLSYWLRHKPDDANLTLDAQGWASLDAVLAALASRNPDADFDVLLEVVEHNDKQRFELSADLTRIRARQGHSVEIALDLAPVTPPETLYHGTVERFIDPILHDGLLRMKRHHVHLSADTETATRIGARRGKPIILEVAAGAMQADGFSFFVTDNGVWLVDHAPARYLRRL